MRCLVGDPGAKRTASAWPNRCRFLYAVRAAASCTPSTTLGGELVFQDLDLRLQRLLQPDHPVDHGVLDSRPFGLIAPVAASRQCVSNPATAFVVEALPRQAASQGGFDFILVLVQPIEDVLVRLRLVPTPVDVQLDLALFLLD